MPSLDHEFPLDLIRHAPTLATGLLRSVSNIALPEYTRVRCDSGDATTTAPPELRADSVVVCEREPGTGKQSTESVLAIIVEVQNGRDARKRFSWPAYTANLRARLRCPVILLVLTPDEKLAQWCAEPIDLGGGYHVQRPLVLPLTEIRLVADPAEAVANPEMAVLAATMQRTEDKAVLDALVPALFALDLTPSPLYSDYVLAALPAAARKYLEEAVTAASYEFQTEFIGRPYRMGKAEGRAEGEAEAIVTFLEARGLEVSDDVRERVTGSTDLDELRGWVKRAATVSRAEELFD